MKSAKPKGRSHRSHYHGGGGHAGFFGGGAVFGGGGGKLEFDPSQVVQR